MFFKVEIQKSREMIYPGEDAVALLENLDLEVLRPEHIFDTLDSQRQQERDIDMAIGVEDDPAFESFGYTGNLKHSKTTTFESSKYRKIYLPSHLEILKIEE